MIQIDGSQGEGGGQILRTSLALSMCTGLAFRMSHIRAKRRKPGLLRQHLTAVRAAQTVCQATVTGDDISSQALEFVPGPVKAGKYRFAVGTAGSATLVLQTVLPALLQVAGESTVHLEGGTHNPLSPPFHFLAGAFFPALGKMGADCRAELGRWGFFPAGGGKFDVTIVPPAGGLRPVEWVERGNLVRAEVLAVVSQVPWEIADDESRQIASSLKFPVETVRAEQVASAGPGNVALLELQFDHASAVFSGFGQLGVSRKKVAQDVSQAANRFFKSGVVADEHLADQLLVPLALAGAGSFTTTEPSSHAMTNRDIVQTFLPVEITFKQTDSGVWKTIVRSRH